MLGTVADRLEYGDCTITNGGHGNYCGYHDPGDDPDSNEFNLCDFEPSSEPAQCSWSMSVDPSARRGRTSISVDFRPGDGPASQATAYLTIGTTSSHPSATTPTHPSQTASGGLPVTGASLPLVGGLAALLLGAGVGLILLTHRRSRTPRR